MDQCSHLLKDLPASTLSLIICSVWSGFLLLLWPQFWLASAIATVICSLMYHSSSFPPSVWTPPLADSSSSPRLCSNPTLSWAGSQHSTKLATSSPSLTLSIPLILPYIFLVLLFSIPCLFLHSTHYLPTCYIKYLFIMFTIYCLFFLSSQ